MYKFKVNLKDKALNGRTITSISKTIGITSCYLTAILNDKKVCSKPIAYCITKCLDKNKEIDYYFERDDDNEIKSM